MPYQLARKPQLVAHRGNSGPSPENTRPAIEQAIEFGVDMVEVDVSLSRDNVPVLIHHPTLDETTSGKGRVDAHSASDLKRLDAGSWKGSEFAGEAILTLHEGLELARHRVGINLDLKSPRAIDPTLRAVRDLDMVSQVVVSGFDGDCVKAVRAREPSVAVLLNHGLRPSRPVRNGRSASLPSHYVAQARRADANGLNTDHQLVDQRMVEDAHRLGLSIWTYTVDDEARLKELAELGIDSITTNWPERMLQVLGRRRAA